MPHLHSLDPQERNVRGCDGSLACGTEALPAPIDVVFRHSGWQPNRDRIRAGLARSGVAQARLDHWDGCGADAWVLRDPENPARLKIASTTCKDRFCVPCADTRSAKIGRRIREKIEATSISFLTLTLADNDTTLTGLLDKLLRSFRTFRQWPIWKAAVTGGVCFVELKWNPKLERWHPHLHAIIESDYMDQAAISARWHEITGTSFIVDIRRPPRQEDVIRYVTRYGSKPLHPSFINDPDRLQEAITSLKGRHLATAFGSWRGWCLNDDDEHERWEPVDTLASLIRRERRGDPVAIKIMEQLRCMTPMAITTEQPPRAPPPTAMPETPSLRNARAIAVAAVQRLLRTRGSQLSESFSVQHA